MTLTHLNILSTKQKQEVLRLWNSEFPTGLMFAEMAGLEKFINGISDLKYIVLTDEQEEMIAWVMIFTRDHSRWFSVLVDSMCQGLGLGSLLLAEAKKSELSLHGWVVDHDGDRRADGSMYRSPLGFYIKNGFTVRPDIRYEQNNVSAVKIIWNKD